MKQITTFLTSNPTYGKGVDLSLLILRIAAGAFMLTHGYPKMMKLLDGNFQFADPLGIGVELSLILAVFAEIICAFFILLGILPRLASIPLIVTMLVAAFIAHAGDPFKSKESSLMYLIMYVVILLLGAGKYSLQGLMKR